MSRGNTAGNISAGSGSAAIQGDWIYFRNPGDDGTLYRVQTDGSARERLSDDSVFCINVSGDWIYYISYINHIDTELYRIRTDGSGREKLSDGFTAHSIMVSGDWIYFRNHTADGRVYRIKIDGSGYGRVTEDVISYYDVSGDWIYYTNHDDDHKLYRIKTDGSGREKLNDDARSYGTQVADGWVYYFIFSDTGPYPLYRIKTDGSGRQSLGIDVFSDINIAGNYVYYTGRTGGETVNTLYRSGIYDSDRKRLTDDAYPFNINVVGDWVIYHHFSDSVTSAYRVRIDGSDRQLLG